MIPKTRRSRGDSSRTTPRCCSAIAQNPDVRARDIADAVGITERAAQRIVADLVEAGYVESARVGRRNHYTINRTVTMRHPAQHDQEIGALLDLLELDEP